MTKKSLSEMSYDELFHKLKEDRNLKAREAFVTYYCSDGSRYEVTAFLWSNPDLPHWKRLSCFWFYLPCLFWRFITGKPVFLGEKKNKT